MAYSASRHRVVLDSQLEIVKGKLAKANDASIHVDLREYTIAAAIFLAHAEFENYYVDVLSGMAGVYSQVAGDVSKLPAKLRAHLIVEKFGMANLVAKIVTKVGEQDVLNVVERWFASSNVTLLTGAAPLSPITGDDIHGVFTYPSITNIERILRRLGVGDPQGSLNREGRRDVVGQLDSIASLRTALAHSATLPGVSVQDVSDRIDGLKVFAAAFDQVLYRQICQSLSDNDWCSLMC